MGGGIAGAELAGAVSAAGGLGTVGIMPAAAMGAELRRAREIAGDRPVAANLLVPFATRDHVEACRGASVVVLHAGFDRGLVTELKATGALVLHTVGTPNEAQRGLADGADGLVVQGIEAGGHLVGVEPALEALARVRSVVGDADTPLLLAGGIADSNDVRRALDAGADAAVAGTRFLLTDECAAHPAYKQAVIEAERTLETRLFGLSWPMRHRVVPNAATERWCARNPAGPWAVRALQPLTSPLARFPLQLTRASIRLQHPLVPIFGPMAALRGMPERLVQASALYAGETALRISSTIPAVQAVRLLAGALPGKADRSPTIPSS